jgi:trehalose 6-phosphate synthase/phosphatase
VYVYIISGRSRTHLDKWFAETGVGLSAEHGCFYRHPKKLGYTFGNWEHAGVPAESEPISTSPSGDENVKRVSKGWFALVDNVDLSYREVIRPLLQHYTDRTPGSFIEEKEINLTWHYRNADPEFGSWQGSELNLNLDKMLSHMAVSVILLIS